MNWAEPAVAVVVVGLESAPGEYFADVAVAVAVDFAMAHCLAWGQLGAVVVGHRVAVEICHLLLVVGAVLVAMTTDHVAVVIAGVVPLDLVGHAAVAQMAAVDCEWVVELRAVDLALEEAVGSVVAAYYVSQGSVATVLELSQ